MPSDSPWMNRRIFGFQRRVWWPKWTPASSSSRMPPCVAMGLLGRCGAVPTCTARTRRSCVCRAGPAAAFQAGSGFLGRASLEDVPLHPLAASGFADVAAAYDRGRPDYPAQVLDVLGLDPGARVLDLAAGTGKLTRVLRAAGFDVVPVEPLPAMRALVPGALDGTAEAIPLEDGSVDAVTIADAWHWFDRAAASAELERVVRPGGLVAILWQYPRAAGVPEWAHALGEILLPLRGEHPGFAAEMTS